MYKKLMLTFGVIFALSLGITAFAETTYPRFNKNINNKFNGFDFELWSEKSEDPVSMTLTGGGNFMCEWQAYNILFRTGKKLGSVSTYEEYGDIFIEYGAIHNITSGDASYLTVYGWMQNPLIEFYVVENYGNYKPPGGTGFQGTYELDDGIYELYIGLRVDKPSIENDVDTFEQYYAVRAREDRRTEGVISVAEHFKAWEEFGLDMGGTLYEVSLCVEGFNTSGNAHVYNHVLTIGDEVYGTTQERPVIVEAVDEVDEVTEEPEASEPIAEFNITEPVTPAYTPIFEEENNKLSFPVWLIGIAAGAIILIIVISAFKLKKKG